MRRTSAPRRRTRNPKLSPPARPPRRGRRSARPPYRPGRARRARPRASLRSSPPAAGSRPSRRPPRRRRPRTSPRSRGSPRPRHVEVAERERLRVGEDQRTVGAADRTSPAPWTRTQASSVSAVSAKAGPAVDISADFICFGVQPGWRWSTAPPPRDVRCGEARPVENGEVVARELWQRRGEDLRARRHDVRLQRMAERGQAAGREARGDTRPGRGDLEDVAVEADLDRSPEPAIACTEPCAVEVGDRAAEPEKSAKSGHPARFRR